MPPLAWRSTTASGLSQSSLPVPQPGSVIDAVHLGWDNPAGDRVALLRAEADFEPFDLGLSGLIGELLTGSVIFGPGGSARVRLHRSWVKHHPTIGDLDPGRAENGGLDLTGPSTVDRGRPAARSTSCASAAACR